MEKRKKGAVEEQVVSVVSTSIVSKQLAREVEIDFYFLRTTSSHDPTSLLLINDGQDLQKMNFPAIISDVHSKYKLHPFIAVGIHAGTDRKNEYGTALKKDYKNRGAKAAEYTKFVFEELLPFVRSRTGFSRFKEKIFAGFSLGGLMALDIVWNHPQEFSKVGIFSGSFWWRSVGLDNNYVEDRDRIMHSLVREGKFAPWLKFYFQTGALDEMADRNSNGVIDSIDDTLGLITELKKKGYPDDAIRYVELADGRHDVETWGSAMPDFLHWALGDQ